MPKIDIGKLIQEEMERQERSVSWLARKLFCDRTNVYKIFKRTTIDTDLLMRISVVLDCDFFSVYVDAIEELSQGNGGGVLSLPTTGRNIDKGGMSRLFLFSSLSRIA